MTTGLSADGSGAKSLISQTEIIYQELADEVLEAIQKIRAGEWDSKGTTQAVKEMRAFLLMVLEERTRVAKLDKNQAGVAYDYALDFDAARLEIGRRLACLRDAGGG